MRLNRISLVIGVLSVIFWYSSSNVFAEGKPNFHIGTLEANPIAAIESRFDDNIFLEPDGEEDQDFIFSTQVGIGLNMPLVAVRESDFNFQTAYFADILQFSDHKDQDRTDHYSSTVADFLFANDFTLRVADDFVKTADPPNSELTDLQKRLRNVASIVGGYTREKVGVDVGYSNIRDDWKSRDNLDKYEHVISTTGTFYYSPKTSVFGEFDFGIIDYDEQTTNSDSDYQQWLVGLKGEVAPKLVGVVKTGYRSSNYEDGRSDFNGVTVYGDLTYDLQERTTIVLSGERGPVESTFDTNSFFEANKVSLRFEHELLEKLQLQGGGFYQRNEYPDSTTIGTKTAERQDDIGSLSVGLIYEVREWLAAKTSYEYKVRESEFSSLDYKANEVKVSLSLLF